jgi:hypothetical protein
MKIAQAISRLQISLNGGVPSNDSRYSSEFLYSNLITMRAKRIKQKLDQSAFLSHENFSTIDCIPLELGTFADCPCYSSDCKVLRSKYELPKIIGSRIGNYVKVYTIQGIEINETNPSKVAIKKYRKTNSDELGYYFHKNRIYITGSTSLKVVMFIAITFDPIELSSLPKCNSEGDVISDSCFNPETEDFPMDQELYEDIEAMLIQKLVTLYQIPQDTQNNDNSNG